MIKLIDKWWSHILTGLAIIISVTAVTYSVKYTQERERTMLLSETVLGYREQVDFVFVDRAVAFYKRKHPKATPEDLAQVQYIARVLVQIAAEGGYGDQKKRVDPHILFGILLTESNANPKALGPVAIHGKLKAIGGYQVNPVNVSEVKKDCPLIETHKDLWAIRNNTCAALSIYNRYLQRYGTESYAILSYLAGPGGVNPQDSKQKEYLRKVLEFKKTKSV